MAPPITDAERAAVVTYLDAEPAGDLYQSRALLRARTRLGIGGAFWRTEELRRLAAETGLTAEERGIGILSVAAVRYALAYPATAAAVARAVMDGPWIEARMVEVIADELRAALRDVAPDSDHGPAMPDARPWRALLAWCDERLGLEALDHDERRRGPRQRRQEAVTA